ncbi:hypothetical protein NDU88_006806 [Pleurodeles waltl]|uniref:Uncharacterized protein n=1 Tax=Pleurodeles waltl TaxID=8319 RepID=A0AAV7WEM3_PLEWA|nr:hypothetical protein NDU88_006806 [Pleurodeles waltl]
MATLEGRCKTPERRYRSHYELACYGDPIEGHVFCSAHVVLNGNGGRLSDVCVSSSAGQQGHGASPIAFMLANGQGLHRFSDPMRKHQQRNAYSGD